MGKFITLRPQRDRPRYDERDRDRQKRNHKPFIVVHHSLQLSPTACDQNHQNYYTSNCSSHSHRHQGALDVLFVPKFPGDLRSPPNQAGTRKLWLMVLSHFFQEQIQSKVLVCQGLPEILLVFWLDVRASRMRTFSQRRYNEFNQ
jgi:hypothetical protein